MFKNEDICNFEASIELNVFKSNNTTYLFNFQFLF